MATFPCLLLLTAGASEITSIESNRTHVPKTPAMCFQGSAKGCIVAVGINN